MTKQNSWLAGVIVLVLVFGGVGLIQFIKVGNWQEKLGQQYTEKRETTGMTQESLPQEEIGVQEEQGFSEPAFFSKTEFEDQEMMTDEEMESFQSELETFSEETNLEQEPDIDFQL